MNERINELFEQALEEFEAENKYATIIVPNPLKEKFAQLIAWECIGLCNSIEKIDGVALECSDAIKQHFGVEE